MPSKPPPLSATLPGTWRLLSRVDVDDQGRKHEEPSLGSDPLALVIFDRSGNFAAQFMKRDRTSVAAAQPASANNTRPQGGYDAYFGTYVADDATGAVTTRLVAALSPEGVGVELTRNMVVDGDRLTIRLRTTTADGDPITRTLTWERVG